MEEKEQGTQRRKFFTQVCLKCSQELRDTLKMNENGYRVVVGSAHYYNRDFYIYGVLDEVEKVGIALMRYEEFLSGDKEPEVKDRMARNIIGSILDEQDLWTRKLNEILVEVLLFQQTNQKEYYQHYLLIRELESFRKLSADFRDFYACDNENIKHSISRIKGDIVNVESSLNMGRCWYLKSKKSGVKKDFSDFRTRLVEAIDKCNSDQKWVLGLSYEVAYTGPSRGLHANIGGPDYDFSIKRVESNLGHLGLLATHILLVCKRLLGTRPKGLIKRIDRILLTNKYPKELLEKTTRPKITNGDFVLAYGDLAEVIRVNESKCGYRSFKVRYLAKPPIETIVEDCFPAQYVKLLFKRKDVARGVRNTIKEYSHNVPHVKISHRKLAESLRKSVVELWENVGLKEYVMGRPDLMRQKIDKMLESRGPKPDNSVI